MKFWNNITSGLKSKKDKLTSCNGTKTEKDKPLKEKI